MAIRINRIAKTTPTARSLKDSLLAEGINTKLLKTEGSTWRGNTRDLTINWGSSQPIDVNGVVLNSPQAVALSSNKLKAFQAMGNAQVHIPEYVTLEGSLSSRLNHIADLALSTSKNRICIMVRETATGYGGQGITPISFDKRDIHTDGTNLAVYHITTHLTHRLSQEELRAIQQAKFATLYFKATEEFRIHVAFNAVIFEQRKALRTDDERPEDPNFLIRNHANGFIFQQNGISIPNHAKAGAVAAVNALGLHFGAVDIRLNTNSNEHCVLEVNTAPALTGNTLAAYTDMFVKAHEATQEG